ncbi:VRR-NUC domain-containing protein [Azotobacter beijerinckii]|uniref:VRR-NUC domain-containing protein n=1 Tax=Azotobacter beijerinckii TaxID=170623 RepID=A0A1H6VEJ0_9GAMM|nr:VRR-NUC domain-containing protein [Azotobacter beijerinckii]
MKWFDLQYKALRGRLVAIPNGGDRHGAVAAKLKAEGVRKGFPDLLLLTPRAGYHGLVIEMKRVKGGTLKDEQAEWLEWLAGQGYMAVVCKGADQARETIKRYLGGTA